MSRTIKDTRKFRQEHNVISSPPSSWKRTRKRQSKAKVRMAVKFGKEPPRVKNNYSDWW